MEDTAKAFPSLEETLNHPAYAGTIWALEPHQKGILAAAQDRPGSVNISWEIHGSGPTKIVLIPGLAMVKTAWQRQTRYFGHDRGSEFSVLILDNRGIGESDKPLARYSTSEMARDVVGVLDHVGWSSPREINLVGVSLGGMIAQELACAAPDRLQSLTLLSTSAAVDNARGFAATAAERLGFLIPKSAERSIADTARQIFDGGWLAAPDAAPLPQPGTTPRCGPAPGTPDGQYRLFGSNFQRFQAQELTKRAAPGWYSSKGVLCQLVAAGWHHKSPEQLRGMADAVGRERIMVVHGTNDNMITVPNGEKLIQLVEPGVALVVEGMGHAAIMERTSWFNSLLEERLRAWAKLDEKQ